MKNLTLTAIFTLFAFILSAQEIWIEAALKGGYGLSFLQNANLANDETYKYDFTTGYNVGGKLAVNFGAFHGIAIEGMFSTLGQDFHYNLANSPVDLENSITWKNVDAYLLYRYIYNRMFVEIGPMYSFVQSIEQMDNSTEVLNPENYYEKNYLSGVFGWGGYIAGSNTFSLGLGMRLHYGFSDFVSPNGEKFGAPNPIKSTAYETYKPTHAAFAEIMMELNFGIGHFAKTACSERMRFFGSGR